MLPPATSAFDLARLGSTVRNARETLGLSRRQLAADSAVSERYLARLEQGDGNISVLRLAAVASALELPLHALVDGTQYSAERLALTRQLDGLNAQQLRQISSYIRQQGFKVQPKLPIALVGLRGAGKSTLGKRLAEQSGLKFLKSTEAVEQLAGMSVSEVFSLSGEAGYQRLEAQALKQLCSEQTTSVIETGGSVVADLATYEWLLEHCFVVWIQASPQEHMQRVIAQDDLRPMANRSDAMADLNAILQSRTPAYSRAHARVNTSGQTVEQSLNELAQIIDRSGAANGFQ